MNQLKFSRSQDIAIQVIKQGRSTLLHGPAGTGKSIVIQYVSQELYKGSPFLALTATTGIAANTIGGTTLHAWMGVGLAKALPKVLVAKIMQSPETLQRWLTTQVLVIDEVSMLSGKMFDKVDAIARLVRQKLDTPFGGIQLILSGDFYQLPPVTRTNRKRGLAGGNDANANADADADADADSDYCFQSKVWQEMVKNGTLVYTEMIENIRQSQDRQFGDLLNRLRHGTLSTKDKALLQQRVGVRPENTKICPTEIFPLLKQAQEANAIQYAKIPGQPYVYNAAIAFNVSERVNKPAEDIRYQMHKLQAMIEQHPPVESRIELKVNTQVMLRRNIDIKAGLVNGARGVVVGFTPRSWPIVLFVSGQQIPIEPQVWVYGIPEYGNVTYTQIPLIQAWAMTIHKSQSLTIDCLSVDLGSKLFAPGQAYTALSRARGLDNVYILQLDLDQIERISASKRVKREHFV